MDRSVLVATFALVAGCRSEINPAYCAVHSDPRCPVADAREGDGAFVIPEAGARTCFGGGNYLVCLHALPTSTLTLSNIPINTSVGSAQCAADQPIGWTGMGQPDACFIIAATIKIDGTNTTARGGRPLVILATNTIDITGELDLSAVRDQQTQTIPAGFDPAASACVNPTPPGDSATGAGGGAGATFGTKAGDGAAGASGAAGTALEVAAAPTALHAGCGGQTGGAGTMPGGGGGNGGGAVLFVAPTINLEADAQVHANGAGGSSGGHFSGGAGGGSGGMIVLWADTFMINASAKLIANGGGGSSGGDNNSNGSHGNDPSTSTPTSVATGGTSGGGHGGNGFAIAVPATSGSILASSGGGGGGGGGGYILANQTLVVNSSPAVALVN